MLEPGPKGSTSAPAAPSFARAARSANGSFAAVRRAVVAGQLAGEEVDVAHAVVALTKSLAAAEGSRRLGTSKASVDRRWALAIDALLDGFAPPA